MNKDELVHIIGRGGSPYSIINQAMAMAATSRTKTIKDDRYVLVEQERVRRAKIVRNICPECDGKLIRGKKDKKNNYKRAWICKECGCSNSI